MFWKPGRKTVLFLLILYAIFVIIGLEIYLVYPYRRSVLGINVTTGWPHLWRRFDIDFSDKREDNYISRIQRQRNWIKDFTRTEYDFINKTKIILVQNYPYYIPHLQMNCPFAPSFSDKCQLIEKCRNNIQDALAHLEGDIAAVEGVSAVVCPRNGYWGAKEVKLGNLSAFWKRPVQIFWTQESPCHTGSGDLGKNDAWLASYWRGSDIPVYNYWEKQDGNWNSNEWKKAQEILSLEGRKPVAALISNCRIVENGREEYISELRKYIPVDFYGRCGNLSCPDEGPGSCRSWLGKRYKFSLAFENCNCVDYISEKPHEALLNYMTPIVMGAPRSNYELLLPPSSFIHVDDFPGPKELAEYLHLLSNNQSLYLKYWEWRSSNWTLSDDAHRDFFCRLCGMLFYNDFIPAPNWAGGTSFKTVNKCNLYKDNKIKGIFPRWS